MYVWADDSSNDRSWHDNAPNSETGEDQETPRSVERISPQASKSGNAYGFSYQLFDAREDSNEGTTLTRCHDDGADNHQLSNMTFEGTEHEKYDHSPYHNTESHG